MAQNIPGSFVQIDGLLLGNSVLRFPLFVGSVDC
jgi:hypothetical protein